MAIVFTNLGVSSVTATNPDIRDGSNAAAYANTAWTPPGSGLIVAFVINYIATIGSAPSMYGNSLTWVRVATCAVDPGTSHRVTLFGANATGSASGITSACFADTQIGCDVSFFEAQGVDLTGGVASAFVQAPAASGTGTSASVTLAAAGNSNNRPIAAFGHQANEATTPDANWTGVDDMNGVGPNRGFETQQDSDGFQNASGSWTTSAAWIAMAAELKAADVGAVTYVPSPVMQTFFAGPV